jgi:hypothetical protein
MPWFPWFDGNPFLTEELRRQIEDSLVDRMYETDRMYEARTGASAAETITLDRFYDLLQSTGLLDPHPRGLWFIDRDDEYREFEDLMSAGVPQLYSVSEANILGKERLRLYGLPVYNFSLEEIEKRIGELKVEMYADRLPGRQRAQVLAKSYPIRQPGVWLEMSDGHHVKLEVEEWA